MSDAALIEAGLVALADVDLPAAAFARFFAAFPDRRAAFIVPEASTVRMTDETLQMLLGLAQGERWVAAHAADLIGNHRSYGDLPLAEFEAWVDCVVAAARDGAGATWDADAEAAWRRQAAALKRIIGDAHHGWQRAAA